MTNVFPSAGAWEEDPQDTLNNKTGAEMQTHFFHSTGGRPVRGGPLRERVMGSGGSGGTTGRCGGLGKPIRPYMWG